MNLPLFIFGGKAKMNERKVIGRLNRYWAKQIQGLAMHYKYPFMDIKEISINTETEEISVIELDPDDIPQTKPEYETYVEGGEVKA